MQNGSDQDGILGFLPNDIKKEVSRGRRLLCTYCRKHGATIECAVKTCKIMFHLPCGIANDAQNLFYDSFSSFCSKHRSLHYIPLSKRDKTENTACLICLDGLSLSFTETIWASCCKTAFYHKRCIQKMALNFGYCFRCPNCNDEKLFRWQMLNIGICIPDQYPSWEFEPNAFSSLNERHSHCDATVCCCPSGRDTCHSNGCWQIILCYRCLRQGIHRKCGIGFIFEEQWTCSSPLCLNDTFAEKPVCILCNYVSNCCYLGKLYVLDDIHIHANCLAFNTRIYRSKKKSEGLNGFEKITIEKELSRCKNQVCVFCKNIGAAVNCAAKNCQVAFHLNCAMLENCTLHLNLERCTPKSYCVKHIPKCIVDGEPIVGILLEAKLSQCCKLPLYHKYCEKNDLNIGGCSNLPNCKTRSKRKENFTKNSHVSVSKKNEYLESENSNHMNCSPTKCLWRKRSQPRQESFLSKTVYKKCGLLKEHESTNVLCASKNDKRDLQSGEKHEVKLDKAENKLDTISTRLFAAHESNFKNIDIDRNDSNHVECSLDGRILCDSENDKQDMISPQLLAIPKKEGHRTNGGSIPFRILLDSSVLKNIPKYR